MDGAPALDPAVLASLRQLTLEGEQDVLGEVLMLYRREASARLDAVLAAIAAADALALQRAAHAYKGASAAIGATALQQVCRDLEDKARQNDLADIHPHATALQHEHRRVLAAIDQLL